MPAPSNQDWENGICDAVAVLLDRPGGQVFPQDVRVIVSNNGYRSGTRHVHIDATLFVESVGPRTCPGRRCREHQ